MDNSDFRRLLFYMIAGFAIIFTIDFVFDREPRGENAVLVAIIASTFTILRAIRQGQKP